jgi:amidase
MFVLLFLLASLSFACARRYHSVEFNASAQTLEDPFPFFFPDVADRNSSIGTPFPMPRCHGITIEETTIVDLQRYLAQGNLTAVQLVECYIRRITQVDSYVE